MRSDSPAARAGLQPGDTVVQFAGSDIRDFDELKRLVARQNPGSHVAIQFRRGNVLYETNLDVGKKRSTADSQTRDDADLLKDWLEQIDLRRRRGRAIVAVGKNADQIKETFHDVLDPASRATVEVLDAGTLVALGTIVDDDLILTKASQLDGRTLRCRFRNSRSFRVEKVAELKSHDLALLKSEKQLPTVKMRARQAPLPGALLASSGLNVWPLAIGVVSSNVTEIESEGKLGIRMENEEPRVSGLVPGGGADTAGVLVRDMITAVDGKAISTAKQLIQIVQSHYPGDLLRLTIRRSGELVEVPVQLVRYSEFDEALAEFEDFIGGNLSERRTGFQKAIQHDTAIRPQHCGGPVVDIHGKFVGINIARAARTTSYLLPASEVKLALGRIETTTHGSAENGRRCRQQVRVAEDTPPSVAEDATPEFPREGRISGVDYGTVRIGFAITDPGQMLSSPLENYTRAGDEHDAHHFRQLVDEESIVGFVVGLPIHLSGDESEKSREARAFGHWLSEVTRRPVVYHDERYTSVDAEEHLLAANLTKKKRKARMDMLAAQMILRGFLESRSGPVQAED